MSEIEQAGTLGDREQWAMGATYAIGGVTVGYQISEDDNPGVAATTTDLYENTAYGVSFAVNDDLSVSYSEARHVLTKTHKANNYSGAQMAFTGHNINEYTPKAWMRGHSIQVAYTIGGVGLKFADTEYDDTGYTFDGSSQMDAKIFAVSLAF